MTNNEGINMAREFDLSGERTLGVFTKPDLCQRDIKSYITSLGTKLGKGFVMVCSAHICK